MIHLRDIPFRAPLTHKLTAADDDRVSELNCRGAHSRACATTPGRKSLLLPPYVFILLACCLTLALCGCFGGQIIGANANAGPLQVSPNSVSFGGVATGATATTNVNVVNQGSAAVNVSQISVSGQAFSVSGAGNLPITVPAGGTYGISVNFVPAGMGAAAGQLTIASDATADGTLVVDLSGTGTSG